MIAFDDMITMDDELIALLDQVLEGELETQESFEDAQKYFELATEDLQLNKDEILESITANENVLERAKNMAIDDLQEATEIKENLISEFDILFSSLVTIDEFLQESQQILEITVNYDETSE